jgi:hypothetical protein
VQILHLQSHSHSVPLGDAHDKGLHIIKPYTAMIHMGS